MMTIKNPLAPTKKRYSKSWEKSIRRIIQFTIDTEKTGLPKHLRQDGERIRSLLEVYLERGIAAANTSEIESRSINGAIVHYFPKRDPQS